MFCVRTWHNVVVTIEMEDATHVDTVGDQFAACCLDVRHAQEHSLSRARHRGRVGDGSSMAIRRLGCTAQKFFPTMNRRPASIPIRCEKAFARSTSDTGMGMASSFRSTVVAAEVRMARCCSVLTGCTARRRSPLPATFAASWFRLSPSTRLNAGNGWMTSARVVSGVPSLIASTSSPTNSPARG